MCADERTGEALRGELGLPSSPLVERALRDVLRRTVRHLDLHLAVPFCDFAGLNMLLRPRLRALVHNKTVTIASSSPAVERLLEVTDARKLVTAPACELRQATGPAIHGPNTSHLRAAEDWSEEVTHLRRAMQTRPAIDLARGILMATFSLTPEAAWAALVNTSQNTNTKLHRLAEDLVNSVHGPLLSENVRGHLGAAVAKAKQTPPKPDAGPAPRNSVPRSGASQSAGDPCPATSAQRLRRRRLGGLLS
ncbi:ANTAR domain protein [Streptomyces rimosus subsp. rimosus]|uniref:ANTAR domain protein n=1 Tax=Streptomyces rimosus subsp. rimosus TaxID=132474 RepID=A0ABY3YT85_STRRM|nr:ANTAR domain protein [Streptomyces rimosus subsp. rimosus]